MSLSLAGAPSPALTRYKPSWASPKGKTFLRENHRASPLCCWFPHTHSVSQHSTLAFNVKKIQGGRFVFCLWREYGRLRLPFDLWHVACSMGWGRWWDLVSFSCIRHDLHTTTEKVRLWQPYRFRFDGWGKTGFDTVFFTMLYGRNTLRKLQKTFWGLLELIV